MHVVVDDERAAARRARRPRRSRRRVSSSGVVGASRKRGCACSYAMCSGVASSGSPPPTTTRLPLGVDDTRVVKRWSGPSGRIAVVAVSSFRVDAGASGVSGADPGERADRPVDGDARVVRRRRSSTALRERERGRGLGLRSRPRARRNVGTRRADQSGVRSSGVGRVSDAARRRRRADAAPRGRPRRSRRPGPRAGSPRACVGSRHVRPRRAGTARRCQRCASAVTARFALE